MWVRSHTHFISAFVFMARLGSLRYRPNRDLLGLVRCGLGARVNECNHTHCTGIVSRFRTNTHLAQIAGPYPHTLAGRNHIYWTGTARWLAGSATIHTTRCIVGPQQYTLRSDRGSVPTHTAGSWVRNHTHCLRHKAGRHWYRRTLAFPVLHFALGAARWIVGP